MNYLVASPGRCGSFFTTAYIMQYKNIITITDNYYTKTITETDNLSLDQKEEISVDENVILHLHDLDLINYFAKNRQIVLIRRNPVEIALSHLIARKTNVYHFGDIESRNVMQLDKYIKIYKNIKFQLHPNEFFDELFRSIHWYLSAESLYENSIVLNYSQAIDIDSLNKRLNLEPHPRPHDFIMPIAQPFNKWNRIEDGNELNKIGNEVFSYYQFKFPHIFPKEDFVIDS
jgi:hypothetical protein